MSKNKKNIHFELSVEEANIIFRALGKLPFEEVYEVIGKLNAQANQQLTQIDGGENLNPNPPNA